jgi:hypothetical protein
MRRTVYDYRDWFATVTRQGPGPPRFRVLHDSTPARVTLDAAPATRRAFNLKLPTVHWQPDPRFKLRRRQPALLCTRCCQIKLSEIKTVSYHKC